MRRDGKCGLSPNVSLIIGALLATATAPALAQAVDPKARLQTAEKMFAERCKKAGEFIYRTAENVEGVFLMKIRPKEMNDGDQFRMDDPYGSDSTGDHYIKSFLYGRNDAGHLIVDGRVATVGFRHVEAIDPQDGKRYRYTGSIKDVTKTTSILMGGDGKTTFNTKEFVLDRAPAFDPQPRYGVTYDDISTREERDYWIAGSSLKVIDLKTNEVMAERIGYMMDRGQGSKGAGSGRSPWLAAASNACPSFKPDHARQPGFSYQTSQARKFVEKVIKPSQER